VIPYPGGYDDYESARVQRERAPDRAPEARPSLAHPRAAEAAALAPAKPSAGKRGRAGSPASGPSATATRRDPSASQKKRKLEALEQDLRGRESRVRELEAQLADPDVYRDGAKARELLAEYERLRGEIESLWERISEL